MKKLLVTVVLGFLLSGNAYAKQLKDIIFGNSSPERILLCDSHKLKKLVCGTFIILKMKY